MPPPDNPESIAQPLAENPENIIEPIANDGNEITATALSQLLIDARVKKRVSERVSPGIKHIIRSETLGETLGKTFRAKKSRWESRIGLYAWLPVKLSPRLVFLRGRIPAVEHLPGYSSGASTTLRNVQEKSLFGWQIPFSKLRHFRTE